MDPSTPVSSSPFPYTCSSCLILGVESVHSKVWWVRMLGIGEPDWRSLTMEMVYFLLLPEIIKPSLRLITDFQGVESSFWKTWWGIGSGADILEQRSLVCWASQWVSASLKGQRIFSEIPRLYKLQWCFYTQISLWALPKWLRNREIACIYFSVSFNLTVFIW